MRFATALLVAIFFGLTASTASADRSLQFATELPASAVGTRTVVIERRAGTGREAEPEQFVVIEYEGFVFDPLAPDGRGRKFDSTKERGQPLSVLVGVGRMITGLDKGILGMRVGGARTLVIPPGMGYGNRNAFGEVPPESTLLFEVELLDVVPQENIR